MMGWCLAVIIYLVPFLASFFIVYLLIPVAKQWAWKVRLIDMPIGRKAHQKPMPLSGGIAMYIGFVAVSILFAGISPLLWVLIIGGALLIGVGSVDDWFKAEQKEFPVSPKLIIQLLAAVIAFAMDIRIRGINFSWLGGASGEMLMFSTDISFLATVLWIVGLTNMVNFLDGADGLAGGVVTFSATTLFFIAFVKGQTLTAVLAVIIVGAVLAFLRFNFYPAEMFMGDAGATFLGFALAVLSLEGAMKSATLISFVVTVLALGLPVIDTCQVFLSRMMSGTPMHQADRRHVHHRLMSIGLSTKQTVLLLYMVCLLFSTVSLLLFIFV